MNTHACTRARAHTRRTAARPQVRTLHASGRNQAHAARTTPASNRFRAASDASPKPKEGAKPSKARAPSEQVSRLFGPLDAVEVIRGAGGQPRGYAFATFRHVADARACVRAGYLFVGDCLVRSKPADRPAAPPHPAAAAAGDGDGGEGTKVFLGGTGRLSEEALAAALEPFGQVLPFPPAAFTSPPTPAPSPTPASHPPPHLRDPPPPSLAPLPPLRPPPSLSFVLPYPPPFSPRSPVPPLLPSLRALLLTITDSRGTVSASVHELILCAHVRGDE